MRAIFSFQARIKAVLGALPREAWVRRPFECLDACMAETFLLLPLIGQESPLECHWNPLFRQCVLSVLQRPQQSWTFAADRPVKKFPEREHIILPFVERLIAALEQFR